MIHVAMAIIFDDEGSFMIAKRPRDKNFGGLWEFPGGKLEDGETPSTAIIREIKEELEISIEPKQILDSYLYTDERVEIIFHPISCKITSGIPNNIEHEEITWINLNEIQSYDFAPPDYEAIDQLKRNNTT